MRDIFAENARITSNSEQIKLLKSHFPGCFDKNGAFLPEKLQALVQAAGVSVAHEGYNLEWLGKSYARLLANENVRSLLAANDAHNALAENASSQNLLIKGDNLEVLKHLVGAYRERVKMIYIDPPYNTGGDGFVYADDRKFTVEDLSRMAGMQAEEAERVLDFTRSKSNSHSAWLTFMYPRLYVARELLRDDGVIFVSIDDNEQAQLKLLMDEVFGEENFVAAFIWQHRKSSQNDVDVSLSHNYVFCYSHQRDIFRLQPLSIDETKFSNPDNDPRGAWVADPLDAPNVRPNLTYPIINSDTGKQYLPPKGRCWRFSRDEFSKALADNRIIFGKNGKSKPQYKRFRYEAIKKGTNPFTIWTGLGTATEATKKLMELFNGEKLFDTPKPIRLLQEILKLSTVTGSLNEIVLDFFAGSGTTAHAVMQLNAEDGGQRQFICVQLDEKTDPKSEAYKAGYKSIFDITRERIQRAAARIKAENPLFHGDLGCKIFETKPIESIPAFAKYLDAAEELTENQQLFDGSTLGEAERQMLLRTWASYDGIPLSTNLVPVVLEGADAQGQPSTNYTAWQGGNHLLYFMYNGLSLDHVMALLQKLDEDKHFAPKYLVVFEGIFTNNSKAKREMTEAIEQSNRKGIELKVIPRY